VVYYQVPRLRLRGSELKTPVGLLFQHDVHVGGLGVMQVLTDAEIALVVEVIPDSEGFDLANEQPIRLIVEVGAGVW
jgi:hypothetical protein